MTIFLLLAFTLARAAPPAVRGDLLTAATERRIGVHPGRTAYTDGLLITGADVSVPRGEFALNARPELRAIWSEAAALPPGAPAAFPLRGPKRFVDLTPRVLDDARARAYFDAQRLEVTHHDGATEVNVGRRLFAAGVLKIFPVWNKFSRPLPTAPAPIVLYGRDQITVAHQGGTGSIRAAYLPEPTPGDGTAWVEGGWLPPGYEVHALAARWWRANVFGVAAAGDLGGATLRLEALAIDDHVQLGLGVERALGAKWQIALEGFYQDEGVGRTDLYRAKPPSRFTLLRARGYSALLVTDQLADRVVVSALALVNHLDGSVYAGGKLEYSLGPAADLTCELKGPLGRRGDEFSSAALNFPNGASLGLPAQFSASYKHYF